MTTLHTDPATHDRTRTQTDDQPSLRERKKVETRSAIHEAAVRLVAENGAGQASVDAICSEAGVSSRTFFNYFPSKVSAIVGLSAFVVTDAQRETFLQGDGEKGLVRDLCILVGDIMDSTARDGVDRAALRELLGRRPELAPDVIKLASDLRLQVIALAEQRTSAERAQLAVMMVMSAVDCALHRPLDSDVDTEFTRWLFDAVMTMQALARESLD